MPYITWTDEFSVGVDLFDREHQELVGFLNKLHIGIMAGDPSHSLKLVLDGLVNYTNSHFRHEEDYMVMYDYPHYKEHKAEHDKLVEKVLEYQKQLTEGKSAFTLDLMNFLKDWVLNHIQHSDMLYKEHFIAKGIR